MVWYQLDGTAYQRETFVELSALIFGCRYKTSQKNLTEDIFL